MSDLTERLIRLRDGTDSEWKREVLTDAVNALAEAEALRERLDETVKWRDAALADAEALREERDHYWQTLMVMAQYGTEAGEDAREALLFYLTEGSSG